MPRISGNVRRQRHAGVWEIMVGSGSVTDDEPWRMQGTRARTRYHRQRALCIFGLESQGSFPRSFAKLLGTSNFAFRAFYFLSRMAEVRS